MTREEAIYELKNAAWLGTDHSRARTEEAVEMAIKALEQEPYICDTCKHKDDSWDTEPCDGCCGNHSGYEPTITSIGGGVIYYPQVEGITPTVVKAEQEPTDRIEYGSDGNAYKMWVSNGKEFEQEPCGETVSRGVFEQVMWERDIAIEQLHELGYELGQKIELCTDAVSRQAVKDIIIWHETDGSITAQKALDRIKQLPSVTLQRKSNADEKHVENTLDDAISRQAVLDCLTATKLKKFDFILQARAEIKALPSVRPQEKTGHWIDMGSGEECSECGEIQYGYDNHRFYCGNCGAKMVESEGV